MVLMRVKVAPMGPFLLDLMEAASSSSSAMVSICSIGRRSVQGRRLELPGCRRAAKAPEGAVGNGGSFALTAQCRPLWESLHEYVKGRHAEKHGPG